MKREIFAWFGALFIGSICLIISIFQPIDGVPGYKLITQEDYSILLGFIFATFVGGLFGYFIFKLFGEGIGKGKNEKQTNHIIIVSPEQAKLLGMKVIEANKLINEIDNLYMENVLMRTEEYLSNNREINGDQIAKESSIQVAKRLLEKYHYSPQQIAILLEQYVISRRHN